MPYLPSGLFYEDFRGDFEPEFDYSDYDLAWAASDSDSDYEAYYQEYLEYQECLEAGEIPSPEEVDAKVEEFLARAGIPQLDGSHLAYFNDAHAKAECYGVSVWEYLNLECPY